MRIVHYSSGWNAAERVENVLPNHPQKREESEVDANLSDPSVGKDAVELNQKRYLDNIEAHAVELDYYEK